MTLRRGIKVGLRCGWCGWGAVEVRVGLAGIVGVACVCSWPLTHSPGPNFWMRMRCARGAQAIR